MNVGSLFAGIGGFDLGFERAGYRIAWHAEIEPHASAVLRHRWPDVPNVGDVTSVHGGLLEPVDVICGGFPCQDLSVAGKRAGLHGSRSSLAFQFIRIVKEMQEATDGRSPAFVVLENVPGLFSSHGGRDFGVLLDALAVLRPVDICWRVLDSRYFGVAQRRRRVFIVVDLGGERAEQVLVEPESLRGDPPARREARQDVAGTLGGGAQERGWAPDTDRMTFVANPLTARMANGINTTLDEGQTPIVTHTLRCDGFDASEDGTGRGTPLVAIAATLSWGGNPNSNAPGRRREDDENLVPVAFNWQSAGDCRGLNPQETTNALHRGQTPAVMGAGVRRLTPRECERLQGFPDDWTLHGTKPDGREYELADGPRYRCLGNAVTVNVAWWIARRMGGVL